jgi:DnaJ-class molecular chaperone
MDDIKNYYEILEVPFYATTDDVKKAFRRQARRYHPDLVDQLTPEEKAKGLTFQDINEAYEVLTNTELRQAYDKIMGYHSLGRGDPVNSEPEDTKRDTHESSDEGSKKARVKRSKIWQDLDSEESPPNARAERKSKEHAEERTETDQRKSDEKDGLSEKVSKLFGWKKPEPSQPEKKKESVPRPSGLKSRGPLYELERGERIFNFTIDAVESVYGTTRKLALPSEGEPELIDIVFPPGIHDKELVTVALPGKARRLGATVRARVNVIPHPYVQRAGLNITVRVPITISEALVGTLLTVPGMHGPVDVKLDPPWKENNPIKVVGQGLGKKSESGEIRRGDLYVVPFIVGPNADSYVPSETISAAAREIDNFYDTHPRKSFPENLAGLKQFK